MSKLNRDTGVLSVDIDVSEYVPKKTDPYVSYEPWRRSFYVSTTEEDYYDGHTKMKDIVDRFIDDHRCGDEDLVESRYAQPFIDDLQKAIDRIKAHIDKP